jgi:hypothetical protein
MLIFPSSPTTGQTSTQNGRTYSWTGYAWELVASGGGGSGEDTLLRSLFVPPAPTSVSASAGNAQATVSWTAPSGVLAQAPVTDYAVQFQPAGGSWQTFTDGTSTATSATVTGLTNGTAYQFRVAAVNAVGTGSYSTASSAVTPVAGDALWASVQLLLPGDTSTNDASSYSRSVSAVGGAAVSASQKRWGAGSLYFDGSGDYLTIPSSSAFSFGASGGEFTIEFWMWMESYGNNYTTVMTRRTSDWQWQIGFPNTGRYINASTNSAGTSFTIQDTSQLSLSAWHHVAWSFDGTTYRLYVDGAIVASSTASGGFGEIGGDVTIGSVPGGGEYFHGYIDDLRITKGSARGYTGATIQVPTAAFPDA